MIRYFAILNSGKASQHQSLPVKSPTSSSKRESSIIHVCHSFFSNFAFILDVHVWQYFSKHHWFSMGSIHWKIISIFCDCKPPNMAVLNMTKGHFLNSCRYGGNICGLKNEIDNCYVRYEHFSKYYTLNISSWYLS